MLQAVLWWLTRDRDRAQRAAGRSGQVMGMVLAVVGWLAFVRGVSGGLWLMVIGLFVAVTVAAERRWAELFTALRGVRVAEEMTGPVVTVPDWLTVDRFLSEVAAHGGHSVLAGLRRPPQRCRSDAQAGCRSVLAAGVGAGRGDAAVAEHARRTG
ncbi:hypothetical protein [Streptomyces sp. NPDC001820]|uniref:hypothetical protein n=1 Tax=Streptomyces sp. NPDC001820 TaxID=3364613 RepID=UPI00367A05DF